MDDIWKVIGVVAAVVGPAITAFFAGVKRGEAKTKRTLNDERRKAQFYKLYAPAYALFLTRHVTTVTGRRAPRFRQRFKNAKVLLLEDRMLLPAFKALFEKEEFDEIGEVEYGGYFPLNDITAIVNSNSQYADSTLGALVESANRAKYENHERENFLTKEELRLFYHIASQHEKLSREYTDF